MARRLAIDNRFDLSTLGDAWLGCYLAYSPITPRDLIDVTGLDAGLSSAEKTQFMLGFAAKHVTGGRVLVVGQGEPVDYEEGDIDSLGVETIVELFQQMTGGSLDPKGSLTEAPPKSEQPIDSSSSGTPSPATETPAQSSPDA